MKRLRSSHSISLLLAILCLLTLALYTYPTVTTSAQERTNTDAVTEAWKRASEAGSYRYTADVVQSTIPKPIVTNVGRTSSQEELHVEGDTSLPDRTMHMQLWSRGGSVTNIESGVKVRVEGDRAFARQGMGEWEEINDFTGLFAPQGDFMAFLSAAKDITNQGTETRQLSNSPISFTRYTFRVDGLSYARYLRDQIQKQQAETGQLPPGVNLDLPRQYVDMSGEGELWIGSDGLPLRQIIHLEMPERPDVRVEADVTVDFTDFGYAQQEAKSKEQETGSGSQISELHIANPKALQQAALFASTLAFCVLIAINSRSKKLYGALALALIVSTVSTPLLQSAHAANFADRQAQRVQEQEQRREEREKESEMVRTLRNFRTSQALSGRVHHPNISPLSPALAPLPDSMESIAGLSATSGSENFNCQDDNGVDSDRDGLTDCQEEFLGTDPDGVDSDGDTITDTLEVQGFDYNGRIWYTDPLEADTDKDGIGDLQEWNIPGSAHATWDTDGDGTPDLFDRDNDGDGVPDNLDLSPFIKKDDVPFSDDYPLLLQVNDLETAKPTFIEFQLRPKNPDHLWYAMNVLDWPKGDNQGQVQDDDGKTFYNQNPDSAPFPNSNGDLKLVPMLEIRISGSPTNLPPQNELEHYGIFVLNMSEDGSDKVVYVPLHLVTDSDEEGREKSRVAFYGKMLYRPDTSWGNAQQVRLVWLVQALVDVCADDGYEDGICKDYETFNDPQVVQFYYDDWNLTGLNVREDHGVDVALIYEDPVMDADLHDDTPLITLAGGLDFTFLAAGDADEDGQRDITVDEIYRRFNHATNQTVSDQERWGITNTLSMEVHAYDHVDQARATIPMTDTKELLERVFTPYWSESTPITPTVMFAREERYRTVNLDLQGQGNAISWTGLQNGVQLTIDLPASGDDGVQVQTLAGLNWVPYQFRASWETCPIDTYWKELARRYPFDDVDDRDEATGLTFGLQMYYLTLFSGSNSVVQVGDVVMETEAAKLDVPAILSGLPAETQSILTTIYQMSLKGVNLKTVGFWKYLGKLVWELGLKDLSPIGVLGTGAISKLIQKFPWLKWLGSTQVNVGIAIGAAVFGVGILITLAVLGYGFKFKWAQIVIKVIFLTLQAIGVISTITAACKLIKNLVSEGKNLWTATKTILGGSSSLINSFTWVNSVALIIEAVVIWGVFLYMACRVGWGTEAFGHLLAYAIAATAMAILMFIISFTVIGTIIVGLFGLIDAVVSFICSWFGIEFSIREFLTKQLASLYWTSQPVVDFDIDTGTIDTSLREPRQGFLDGNGIKASNVVTTSISTNNAPWWMVVKSPWDLRHYRDKAYFESAAFNYKLDRALYRDGDTFPQTGYPAAERGDTQWGSVTKESWWKPPYIKREAEASQPVSLDQYVSLESGINYHVPIALAISYALPGVRCVYVPGIFYVDFYVCWRKTFKTDTALDMGLVYDVFPATLDEFYSLKATERIPGHPDGGYRLDWDDAFRALRDADGDGLISRAYFGNDPDDSKWDTDGDGLSDAYELTLRQEGVNISASSPDTDYDGLSDAEEARLGTDPALADTDRDGLTDKEEVDGWQFTCGQSSTHTLTLTWVTSDPTESDTDGDGMDDLAEKTLHELSPLDYVFHPRVPNDSPVALYAAISDEDAVVAPGMVFTHTASLHNNFVTPLYSAGDLSVVFPPALDATDIVTDFMLFMGQAITLTTDVIVRVDATSEHVDIAHTADSTFTGNPTCANVRFDTLHCVMQNDIDDLDPGGPSEVIVQIDEHTGAWIPGGVSSNTSYPMDYTQEFCDQGTMLVWEAELGGSDDDTLESWTIDAQNPGAFNHPIDDDPARFIGSLDYTVFYPSGSINLQENVPVLIDSDAPSTSTITSLSDGQFLQGTGETLIIGGVAQDPTSSIASVEISINSGDWEVVDGAESWAYAWQIPVIAGSYTLRTRATDVVGHVFTETAGTTVIVDIYRPEVSTPIESGAIVTASLDAEGQWTVPLYGTVEDWLDFGGLPEDGSGVRSLEVLLEGEDEVAGRGWQTATLTASGGGVWNWSLDYVFPNLNNDGQPMTNPTGEYIFLIRATDNVGNVPGSPPAIPLRIDNTAPVASVTDTGPLTTVITQSLTIGGVITDPSVAAKGVAGLEIAYTPVEMANTFPPSDLDLLLHLDEPAGATTFRDAAGNNDAACVPPECPTSGVSGVAGTAVDLNRTNQWIEGPDLNIEDDFTIALWVNPITTTYRQAFVSKHTATGGNIIVFGLYDGGYRFHLRSAYHDEGTKTTGWQHLVAVGRKIDPSHTEVTMYKDSQLLWQYTLSDVVGDATGKGWAIGQEWDGDNMSDFFGGAMDEVAIFNRALSESEVQLLYEMSTTGQPWFNWQPATLAEAGVGITRTTWSHVVPSDLEEGFYHIDLRGTDVFGHLNDSLATWTQWQGEIDIVAPRVEARFQQAGTGETARTEYTCEAEDFGLSEDGFQCPCLVLPEDRHYFDPDWYRTWITDTMRLYRIETSCMVPDHQPASTAYVYACDRYGHCAEDSPIMLRATASITSPLDSVVFTPTYGTVFTTTDPISIAGGVYAERTLGLKALTVTVDSTVIYTDAWGSGTNWGERWSTTWLAPTEGPHTLSSVAADHHGYVQTDTHPITIVVDTQPPEIALPSIIMTTAHRLPSGLVAFTGRYTETGGVDVIHVRPENDTLLKKAAQMRRTRGSTAASDDDWGTAALLDDDTWRFAWPLGEELDGEPYTITVRITDVAGRTAQQTGPVTVDLVPPAAVTVTLAYTNSLGVRTAISPGQTIYDAQGVSPTLSIEWTASSDGSGLSGYLAGWTMTETIESDALTFYGPAADRRHTQQVSERQALYAHLAPQDIPGNRQWHTFGPIYVDSPTTPDYIADLDYHGWMESGCTQIGADRELARYAQTGQALNGIQRFYTTWDTDTLRLAWTGANWNSDGDLFIYFDTAPDGATAAYNPYTSAITIILPSQGGQQLEADYLVWVEDADTATLMQWDSGSWIDAITDTLSAPPYYQINTSLHPAHTDLILPFSWLNITETTSLRMVALASEEDALRIWAAMPEKNPLNSDLAINTLAEVGQIANLPYTLTQQYEWALLGSGVCPNAGQFTDADLLVDLTADPPGVEVGYLEHDLLYLTPGQPLDADLDGEPDVNLPMDTDPGLVGHGEVVTYTVHYANYGTEVAPSARVTVTARGALDFGGSPTMTLDLNDVGVGVTGTVEFTGTVDTSVYTALVEVDATIADGTHGPFDWLWVQHDVDTVAPESVEIVAPLHYVKPYTNTVRGTVYDPSGVPTITLEALTVPTGTLSTVACTDPTPYDGQWSCAWNIGDANNGAQYELRAVVTDTFGNGPTFSDWVTLTVDTLPPTITIDAGSDAALQGAVLGPADSVHLTGLVGDDQQASGAEICFEQTDGQYCDEVNANPGTTITGTWSYVLRAVGELDHEDQTTYFYGVDGAGNRSTEPLSRTYGVDTVPPVVTVTTWVRHLPAVTPTLVLSGTVSDGSGTSDVHVLVESPDETLTSTLATRDGDVWSYTLHPASEGNYALRIEARDAKGNASGYGPYNVSVGVKTIYLPLVLRNQ